MEVERAGPRGAGDGVRGVGRSSRESDQASLVASLREGPPEVRELAFGELVARFQDLAVATAYALLGDFHLAEDAAQEAFAAAWRALPTLREPAAFPAWFRRIVVSQAHRILRGGRVREVPLDEGAEAPAERDAPRGDPVVAAEARDLRSRVLRALGALPEPQRLAVVLYYLGGRSVSEAAFFLGVPPSTVKNRLHAARRILKAGDLRAVEREWVCRRPSGGPDFSAGVRSRLFPFRADLEYYEARARGLAAAQRSGLPPALGSIRRSHPRLAGRGDAEILAAPFVEEDARLVLARQHGFPSWEAFAAHIARLAAGGATEPFMAAFRAIEDRDPDGLRAWLDAHPALVAARGTNGNTLLHLAAGARAEDCAALLLGRGAGAGVPNERGSTPLHQAAYANLPRLAGMLLAAGAARDVPSYGDGGTPLVWALFWGHVDVTEVLARRGIVPANLRAAAGTGRLDLLASLFRADGTPLPEAGAHRAFYRPHTGFPEWAPSDDPQETLDEALTYAARSGRVPAMAFLVARGADLDADPYRGTPLIWAAATGQAEAVGWLVAHGAAVNRRATFGGPAHGQGVTALHVAAQAGRLGIVRLLVERGADRHLRDDLHGGDPAGWAAHAGGPDAAAVGAYLEGLG